MKMLHIAGSPKPHGNSNTLANHLGLKAEKLGVEVASYPLNDLQYQGCQACYGCKTTSDHCVLSDDLTAVFEKMYTMDILLLSTPVYFADVTGQMKCFIDRLFSFAKPDYQTNPEPSRLPAGKTLIFIQTQGAEEGEHKDIYDKYARYFTTSGFEQVHLIRACGALTPKDILADQRLINRIDEVIAQAIKKKPNSQTDLKRYSAA